MLFLYLFASGVLLKFVDEEVEELKEMPDSVFSLTQLAKALEFTLKSSTFNKLSGIFIITSSWSFSLDVMNL